MKNKGFTLLEILIALFIFTILSLILVGALRSVINAEFATEKNAERLRTVQMGLLVLSRDIEQTVNRPMVNADGKEEQAFQGSPQSFTFTHAGVANPVGTARQSTLQRTSYSWHDNAIWRATWQVLDEVIEVKPALRQFLPGITTAQFQYLDSTGRFHDYWPVEGQTNAALPRAVSVNVTISQWGNLSQIYVIPAQPSAVLSAPPKP